MVSLADVEENKDMMNGEIEMDGEIEYELMDGKIEYEMMDGKIEYEMMDGEIEYRTVLSTCNDALHKLPIIEIFHVLTEAVSFRSHSIYTIRLKCKKTFH